MAIVGGLITKKNYEKLYRQLKTELGYPARKLFELTDEMVETFIEMSLEDYSSYVNDWLIHQQWVNLQGLDLDGTTDFFTAFTTKTNKFMESFTYAYSKQVGQGTNAPAGTGWELKRDYITISANTQHYIIPAHREVNEVLWETPPAIDQGLVDPFAMSNWASGSFGWSYMGRPAQYVQPTYSLLLAAQDRRMKQRILQSELTYRITGLEDGRKVIHLYPVPGGRREIRDRFGKHYAGRKVWYFYYDTLNADRDVCLSKNDDVVRLPSDPPVDVLKYEKMNSSAQKHIRDLLIGRAKVSIGTIRGTFSGSVGSSTKELTMDYRHLLDEGQNLLEKTQTDIKALLDKISLAQLTKERADISFNINAERQFQPPTFPIMTI